MTGAFIEWVRTCANTVGLSAWEIEVVREELPKNVIARCRVPRARQFGEVVVDDEFFDLTPEEQRATIVHELLHCHFAQITEVVEESLPVMLGKPAYHVFEVAHDLALERCLEATAVAFAEMLPVPPEGE
jgi:hypothetical protein